MLKSWLLLLLLNPLVILRLLTMTLCGRLPASFATGAVAQGFKSIGEMLRAFRKPSSAASSQPPHPASLYYPSCFIDTQFFSVAFSKGN